MAKHIATVVVDGRDVFLYDDGSWARDQKPEKAIARCDSIPAHEWENEGRPVQSEYEPSLFSGWRRCKVCGVRQHYTAAGSGEGRTEPFSDYLRKRVNERMGRIRTTLGVPEPPK